MLVLVLVEVGSINLGGWSACGGGWEVGRQGASSSVTKLSTARNPEEGIHCSLLMIRNIVLFKIAKNFFSLIYVDLDVAI